MAIDTIPTFQASVEGEPTYFIRFPFEGTVYCVGFDTIKELKDIVADNCAYPGEYIITFAETSMEWNESPPASEVAADCDCRLCRSFPAPAVEFDRPAWQLYIRGVLWCGGLALPWIAAWYGGRALYQLWS